MKIDLCGVIDNKIIRSFVAVIAAISWWMAYEGTRVIERKYTVPCCFYQNINQQLVQAPEEIAICLRGTRRALSTINPQELAIHINLDLFCKGKHRLAIDEENLFLPPTIKLVDWSPAHSYMVIS